MTSAGSGRVAEGPSGSHGRAGDEASTGPPAQSALDLERLAQQWRSASDQVFAAALSDPDGYVRTARLVGAVVERLRSTGWGVEPLLAAWREHRDLVESVAASDELLSTHGLEVTAVAGAAFALRHREVVHRMAADARREVVAALPPDVWSVVEESGYSPGDPYVPYRRIEVHPATGRALLVTTSADEEYRGCLHLVEVGSISAATGELAAEDTDPAPPAQFGSESEREAHVAALKASATPGSEV